MNAKVRDLMTESVITTPGAPKWRLSWWRAFVVDVLPQKVLTCGF